MIQDAPKIILGPIIGKVTNITARISIELDSSSEVTCILTTENGKQIKNIRQPEKGFPTLFKFTGLEPETLYKVSIENGPVIDSQFRTLRNEGDKPGKLEFAVISCNEAISARSQPPEKDLWKHLSETVNSLDYIFHIGDQCYMDIGNDSSHKTVYQVCKEKLEAMDPSLRDLKNLINPEIPEIIDVLETLRAHYRLTWSHPPTAYVLSHVPNIMSLDDHEIRDDWGWREEDYDPKTPKIDYFYGQIARRVYYEYQRQLRDDIDWANLEALKCEYHDHILNGVGIAFVDYRGSRSWFREEKVKELQLGLAQTEWVKSLFAPQGSFENASSVLFISPIPIVMFCHILTAIASIKIDDAKEHWSYKNTKELKELLDILRGWKEHKGNREITLIGGDVHIGGYTEVFYKKKPLFKQFTTSTINNDKIQTKLEFVVVKFFQNLKGKIESDYSYKHYDWTRENNYGLMKTGNKNGEPYVEYKLVQKSKNGIIVDNPRNNIKWDTNSGWCNIF